MDSVRSKCEGTTCSDSDEWNSLVSFIARLRFSKSFWFALAGYVVLTIVLTYPVAFHVSDKLPGGGGDAWQFLWTFWWYKHALLDLHTSPFNSALLFYPQGIDFTQITTSNSLLSIPLQQLFGLTAAYNILWLSTFVFSGIGAFLLSHHFIKTDWAPFIAGMVFAFSPYHMARGLGHFGLMTIQWIPFYVLFLLETIENQNKRAPILAGVFLALSSLSDLYYLLHLIILTVILFSYRLVKGGRRRFDINILKRLLVAGATFLALAGVFLAQVSVSAIGNPQTSRPLAEFLANSPDLIDFFHPGGIQTFMVTYFYSVYLGISRAGIEGEIYLGYTVLVLSGLAIAKRGRALTWWVITALVFAVLTLGPYLHVFKENTWIPLPGLLFYLLPIVSSFRSPSRAAAIVMLSLSVLSAHGVEIVLGRFRRNSFRKHMMAAVLAALIMFEFASIPYPMVTVAAPSVYYEIAKDPGNFVVLEAPIGGSGSVGLLSDPIYDFYQTIHGKPIIGGYATRTRTATERFVQRYFLNAFVWYDIEDDVIEQNLPSVGASILNYYGIRYVIIHKTTTWYWIAGFVRDNFVPHITRLLQTSLGNESVIENDDQLIAFRVPPPQRDDPFIVMGDNWSFLERGPSGWHRLMGENATLIIINPTTAQQDVGLNLTFQSIAVARQIGIYLNDKQVFSLDAELNPKTEYTGKIELNSGLNLLQFRSAQEPTTLPAPTSYDPTRTVIMDVLKVQMLWLSRPTYSGPEFHSSSELHDPAALGVSVCSTFGSNQPVGVLLTIPARDGVGDVIRVERAITWSVGSRILDL
jgi:hypothetical protein